MMRKTILLLLLVACGSSSEPGGQTPSDLIGIYYGAMTMTSAPGQGFDATLVISSADQSGLAGSVSLPSGTMQVPFTGTYSHDTLTIRVVSAPPYAAEGTARLSVTNDGTHLSGDLIGDYGAYDGQTFTLDLARQ